MILSSYCYNESVSFRATHQVSKVHSSNTSVVCKTLRISQPFMVKAKLIDTLLW